MPGAWQVFPESLYYESSFLLALVSGAEARANLGSKCNNCKVSMGEGLEWGTSSTDRLRARPTLCSSLHPTPPGSFWYLAHPLPGVQGCRKVDYAQQGEWGVSVHGVCELKPIPSLASSVHGLHDLQGVWVLSAPEMAPRPQRHIPRPSDLSQCKSQGCCPSG